MVCLARQTTNTTPNHRRLRMKITYFELFEAADYLGISQATIKEWMKSRNSNTFRNYCTYIGQRRIITYENMRRYLNGLEPINVATTNNI